ncbi:MAG: hypothetical protein ABFD82_00315 [Syntrophaceae bacterium]
MTDIVISVAYSYYPGNNISKTVIPAKAGIQNGTGCPRIRPVPAEAGIRVRLIKSGMTMDMFNCRSNSKDGDSCSAHKLV